MNQFAEPETVAEYARACWEEGEQRVARHSADSRKRAVLEEVVEAIVHELEKHVGQVFSTVELWEHQERSETWVTRVAHEVAPEDPWAWDMDTVQNAAFYRYARRATDYQAGS